MKEGSRHTKRHPAQANPHRKVHCRPPPPSLLVVSASLGALARRSFDLAFRPTTFHPTLGACGGRGDPDGKSANTDVPPRRPRRGGGGGPGAAGGGGLARHAAPAARRACAGRHAPRRVLDGRRAATAPPSPRPWRAAARWHSRPAACRPCTCSRSRRAAPASSAAVTPLPAVRRPTSGSSEPLTWSCAVDAPTRSQRRPADRVEGRRGRTVAWVEPEAR
jgi:hypothetical protein